MRIFHAVLSVVLLGICTCSSLSGQIVYHPAGQRFAFQVKQIDEFIERFNGENSTLLRVYMQKHFPDRPMSRYDLLASLFNQADTSWIAGDIEAFLRQITDRNHPVCLSYYDRDWYAQLDCQVMYKGKEESVSLVLQVETTADKASEWVLRSVDAAFLHLPEETHPSAMLNPVSHGTDFINLEQLFRNKRYIRSYLHRDFEEDALTLFIRELAEGNLEFGQIRQITYHFFAGRQLDIYDSKIQKTNTQFRLVD